MYITKYYVANTQVVCFSNNRHVFNILNIAVYYNSVSIFSGNKNNNVVDVLCTTIKWLILRKKINYSKFILPLNLIDTDIFIEKKCLLIIIKFVCGC